MATTTELVKAFLIGKKLKHRNQWRRDVSLEVEDVILESGSRDIEPATRENDWYPASVSWSNYLVTFIDGSQVKFDIETNWEVE